jgi:hypothetical protein
MNGNGRVGILVDMPTALKKSLVRRVRERGSNMNDEANAILAKSYGHQYEPTGRRSHPSTRGGSVLLRVDPALKMALQLDALKSQPSNLSHQVLRILGAELQVEIALPRRNRSPFGGGSRDSQRSSVRGASARSHRGST